MEDLYDIITTLPETSKMDRLGITKNALFYLYYDAERMKSINHSLGRQMLTMLHIAVLELKDAK